MCHVQENASQQASRQGTEEKHRNEAVEQNVEVRHSMQEQYLVEGAARQETCKPQFGSDLDLEYGRFGEYIKQLEERWAKLEDRLTAQSRPKSSRRLHNGGITWLNVRGYWTMTVEAWWSK